MTSTSRHTADFEGKMYNVYEVLEYVKGVPVEIVATGEFRDIVRAGQKYWDDPAGQALGPHEMLQDWEAAKRNPLWAEHVRKVESADLGYPILVHRASGIVFDGMHRLTKAFLKHVPTIKVKHFEQLPDSAIVANHPYRRRRT